MTSHCVAFARALAQGLLNKYGVVCDPEAIEEKVTKLCPCWGGHEAERILEEWNMRHKEEGATIVDVEKRKRYCVRVESRKLDTFSEAYRAVERAEALRGGV